MARKTILKKLYIPYRPKEYHLSLTQQSLISSVDFLHIIPRTGWIWHQEYDIIPVSAHNVAYHSGYNPNYIRRRYWLLKGRICTPMEVFETLTPEQQAKAVWELDEWK